MCVYLWSGKRFQHKEFGNDINSNRIALIACLATAAERNFFEFNGNILTRKPLLVTPRIEFVIVHKGAL